jgi:hypothetical protein
LGSRYHPLLVGAAPFGPRRTVYNIPTLSPNRNAWPVCHSIDLSNGGPSIPQIERLTEEACGLLSVIQYGQARTRFGFCVFQVGFVLMTPLRLMVSAISTGGLLAAATVACAQPNSPGLTLAANDFPAPSYALGAVTTGRTLEWDSRKGRWGLKLGVEQRTDRLGEWRDVQPGLYYKLTPRLHIGGAVSLAPNPQVNQLAIDPQATKPRVRLETTFKF